MSTSTLPDLRLRVAAKRPEAEGVVSFQLVDALGQLLPGFSAGAHIDIHLPGGAVRQYSLCNPSQSPATYEIAVLREPASRGGSRFMHESLVVGADIAASVPRNHFPLVTGAPALLFAGGIGITPVLAMAQELAESGSAFELHYCARSPSRAAFVKRLADAAGAAGAAGADRVHLHYDDGPAQQKLDVAAVLARATPAHHLYVCGPGGFIQHVLEAARKAGWSDERVHREFFAAPAAVAVARESSVEAFEIGLARSGRQLQVPADKTVLEVLTQAGIDVPASCEAGVCGTCVTRVIEGIPDHRDVYLTNAEHARNDCFTPCCSRSRTSRLVIDL